jgi:hypothetical protein
VYRRARLARTAEVVVDDDVVVGPGGGTEVVVVVVVGVLPLGPDGDLVSQPAMTAHSRTAGPTNLRMGVALSDRCGVGIRNPRRPYGP